MKNSIQPFKGRQFDLSRPVFVYRDLTRKGRIYSVKQNGLVVGKTENICLENVSFIVLNSGKERALKTRQRNVHAFIKGHISSCRNSDADLFPVKYFPFEKHGFVYLDERGIKKSIRSSNKVLIKNGQVLTSI